jgi:DNA-binding IclR family transcriptional regulator
MATTQAVRPPGTVGGVKSVVAALDVLDCFVDRDELGVSDIARRLGVAKSTAHRLLRSLCARGLAEHDPRTGRYRLGLHLVELGQLTADRMRLRRAALPVLEELRQASGCSTQLGVASGTEVFFVGRLETLGAMAQVLGLPRRLPVTGSAAGTALAAFDPLLARACRAALPAPAAFDDALAAVRRQGFAVSASETAGGPGSVAAPVLDPGGHPLAAVALLRPAEEVGADLGRYGRLVGIAARRLARALTV